MRLRHPRRIVALAGAAAAALVMVTAPASAVPPSEIFTPFIIDTLRDGRVVPPHEPSLRPPNADPFFAAPDVPAGTRPGTLLRARQVDLQVYQLRPGHVRAWQLLYTSTGRDGSPRVVSGLLMIPEDGRDDAARPLIGYVEANDSLAGACNPSTQWTGNNQADPSLFAALGPVAQMFGRGWAVFMSDFVNDGERGPHPFSVGAISGPAVLDGLRAVGDVGGTGLQKTPASGLFGIAGGGVAAAHAAERHTEYAPELDIRGVVLQAMIVDSATFEETASGGVGSGYVFANALGYAAGYPEDIDLDAELTPFGRRVADVFQASCQQNYLLAPFIPLHAYFRNGLPAHNPAFARAYAENRLGRAAPRAPVLLASCRDDFLVPYTDVEALSATYRAGGTRVDMQPSRCSVLDYATDLYGTGTDMLGMQTLTWLDQVLPAVPR